MDVRTVKKIQGFFQRELSFTNMVFVLLEIYIPGHMKVSVQILLRVEGFWKLEVHW